eukprot:TRINITY_DN939_c0_g1_i1.p1 TRINITY_DN939_c0_g1~~TRINITY_DN939_c0_g1_i1.p1  ORF type:complete len:898 (-),score=294.71 TRINITY_DN939_c0_g1_i1:93-2786(-)
MPKEKKKRKDKWSILAKEQGYRARSAFKLVQLNQKYDFLGGCRALIDLCAAPGGWLQVARKFMPVSSLVIGVDLMPIRPISNVITLQEDITTTSCRNALKKSLANWKVDVVLHDGSPKMGSAWLQDAYTQSDLVLKSLKLATDFLVPNGTFITKVFRSSDYNALMFIFNQLFKKVDVTKPVASRSVSAEIYVVCTGYLKPDKIDPRLLDSKYVFKEVDSEPKPRDVFAKKQTRHRDGYETGNYTLFKTASVAEFINSNEPVPLLAAYNKFLFDDAAAQFTSRKETTPEIKALCEDLRLLSKGDFKNLLKWRLRMREYIRQEEETLKPKQDEAQAALTAEEEQKLLDDELEQRLASMESRDKRAKKKVREKKAKLQRRIELGMLNPADVFDAPADDALFALDTIRDTAALKAVTTKQTDNEKDKQAFDTADWSAMPDLELLESSDSEDEPLAYEGDGYQTVLEKYLDNMYGSYVTRAKKRGVELFHKNARPAAAEEEGDSLTAPIDAPDMDDYAESVRQQNPLLVAPKSLVVPPSSQVDLWFANKIFSDVGGVGEEEEEDKKDDEESESEDDEEEEDLLLDEEEEDETAEQQKLKLAHAKAAHQKQQQQQKKTAAVSSSQQQKSSTAQSTVAANGQKNAKDVKGVKRKRDIAELEEEVVIPKTDPKFDKLGLFAKPTPGASAMEEEEEETKAESTDTSDMEESDDDEKSVTLAIGRKMQQKKKRRRDMEDDAYNRYAFNDDDLPSWFVDDENRHNKPELPITKEEADLMKAKWRAIDARPIKKVIEAKARKKKRAMKKMEKMKKKAAEVAKTSDLSEKEKIRAIEKMYKTMGKTKKTNTVYLVRKKFQKGKGPGTGKHSRVRIVDPRMKKDKKAEKVTAAHSKGKKFNPRDSRRKHKR